jgi:glutathione S-transferase
MLTLCGFGASNYHNKVKLVLLEKGIAFEEDLKWVGQADMDASPLGKIPYLKTAEGSLCEQSQFIPMLSVKLPYIKLLGYNTTIKLDDRDFASTNPGVWCHSLHDLKDRRVFTDWSQYTKDEIVK